MELKKWKSLRKSWSLSVFIAFFLELVLKTMNNKIFNIKLYNNQEMWFHFLSQTKLSKNTAHFLLAMYFCLCFSRSFAFSVLFLYFFRCLKAYNVASLFYCSVMSKFLKHYCRWYWSNLLQELLRYPLMYLAINW